MVHPGCGKLTVRKLDTEDDVAVALAKYVADLSNKFIRKKGSFTVVLSGGTLIETMRKLLEPPYIESVEWEKWVIVWLDERVVPLDNPDSNYKLAYDGFLSKVPIPSSSIYPIHYDPSAEKVAIDYEFQMKKLVATKVLPFSSRGFPIFDLQLLGMGPDGHVASLFPHRPQRFEKKRWVTFITDSPKPPPPRITFTFPVINSSPEIALVVTGADLAHAVGIALGHHHRRPGTEPLPVQEVSAVEELTWFLDKDAASEL